MQRKSTESRKKISKRDILDPWHVEAPALKKDDRFEGLISQFVHGIEC